MTDTSASPRRTEPSNQAMLIEQAMLTKQPVVSEQSAAPNRMSGHVVQAISSQSALQSALPNRAVQFLGVALALTATDPAELAQRGPVYWLLTIAVMVAAIWAAPIVAQRPAIAAVHWNTQLARHRNTVFAVGCTVIAGLNDPPAWLIVVAAALLMTYLLAVDTLAAGPIGIRQLRHGVAPLAATAATAVTLLGAAAPVNSGAAWGRIVAAVAVTAAALATSAALWIRQRQRAGAQD